MLMAYIPCKDNDEARKISKHLLDKKLIACAGMWPITSLYCWKGEMQDESEHVIFAKTLESKKEEIIKEVESLHSYEIPCIEFFQTSANKAYENWVKKVLK